MARVLITGSSDGIGRAAAQVLANQGHRVILHARNERRAREAHAAVPQAENVLIGDLSTIAGAVALAKAANEAKPWDCVVHNAGLGPMNDDTKTGDGFASTFAVNSLAPYILTSLMEKPKRLLYLSSALHTGADDSLEDVTWQSRPFSSVQAYSDSKLHNILLANYVARIWPDVQSCSLDPGLVGTRMVGGVGGSVDVPAKMIAEFAAGETKGSGVYLSAGSQQEGILAFLLLPLAFLRGLLQYFFPPKGETLPVFAISAAPTHEAAWITERQGRFVEVCEALSGVKLQ